MEKIKKQVEQEKSEVQLALEEAEVRKESSEEEERVSLSQFSFLFPPLGNTANVLLTSATSLHPAPPALLASVFKRD